MHKVAGGNLQLLPHHSSAFSFVLNNCRLSSFWVPGLSMKKLDQFCSLYHFLIEIQFYWNKQCFNVKMWLE